MRDAEWRLIIGVLRLSFPIPNSAFRIVFHQGAVHVVVESSCRVAVTVSVTGPALPRVTISRSVVSARPILVVELIPLGVSRLLSALSVATVWTEPGCTPMLVMPANRSSILGALLLLAGIVRFTLWCTERSVARLQAYDRTRPLAASVPFTRDARWDGSYEPGQKLNILNEQ